MVYFRRPGQKVNYTPLQTARYVSKLARSQRGSVLTPTYQKPTSDGYQFGFFSARGPANAQGHWIVTASRNDGGGGGGGGGGGNTGGWTNGEPSAGSSVSLITIQWVKYFLGEDAYNAGDLGVGVNDGHPWPYNLQPYPYPSDFVVGRIEPLDGGTSLEGAYTYRHSTGLIYPSSSAPYPGYLMDYSRVEVSFIWSNGLPPTARVDYWHEYYYEISNYGVAQLSGGGTAWEPPETYPYGGAPPPPAEPDGGKYIYGCTCPDYTKTQPRLLAPVYPSDHRNRSWANSNAGALAGPPKFCKHIAAAVRLLGDGEFLAGVDWSDLPANTFVYDDAQQQRADFAQRLNPDNSISRGFWGDVNQFTQQRRRQQQLNNNLDWISRVRRYDRLAPTGTLDAFGTPNYGNKTTFGVDYTGRNLSPDYFARRASYVLSRR
ncbi:hypothetical protein [Leptothoe sp. PORK10 BA2]|uniref:hypothetical protein n=1 Tax=Leptothoe sp. PORK10 BA2 TaxID=3110254 RepID=UPI002B1FF996|nr:hypothetical protein [Leptothoe sp. PORK10 BA2]MEA5465276.1 hypothetical protein [Leptothoe sp. PORK10 BA2]